MTKIEELEERHKYWLDIPGQWQWRFDKERLEAYKSAIREQVVIDAFPSVDDIDDAVRDYIADTNGEVDSYSLACCVNDVYKKSISLTTREEVERPYVELLRRIVDTHFMEIRFKDPLLLKDINSLTDGK